MTDAAVPAHLPTERGISMSTEGSQMPFVDGEAIVFDKPAGLPVSRPRRGGVSMDDILPDLRFGFQRLPVPVHRLDADTSGCLLLARHPKALVRFNRAFEERAVEKGYIGIVGGDVAADMNAESGTIDLPLAKISTAEAGWRMIVDGNAMDARSAITHWRVLAHRKGYTLIEFRPETGRTHQLRVHALHGFGRALIGDPLYGEAIPAGMMLHSHFLRLSRPGKADINARAAMPTRFYDLGFSDHDLQY